MMSCNGDRLGNIVLHFGLVLSGKISGIFDHRAKCNKQNFNKSNGVQANKLAPHRLLSLYLIKPRKINIYIAKQKFSLIGKP